MSDVAETTEIEILDPEKPIAAYNPIRAGIEAMAEKYGKTVFSVATTKDMEAAKEARVEIRDVRYKIEHVRKALKEPALAYSKRIDEEAREYTDAILKIETPIDEQIKAEEKRKADEKAVRERREAERRKAIDERIWGIGQFAVGAVGLSSVKIAWMIETLQADEITLNLFGDRAGEAETIKQQTLKKMAELHAAAVAHEAEQERLAAEREALDQQRKEQDKAQADAKAKADSEEAQRKAENAKQQAALQAQQAEIDRQKQELADALAATAKAEQDRLDKRDAEAKAAKDKADAEAAAAKKKADDEAAEAARRERVQFEQNGPGDAEIIEALAQRYRVSPEVVWRWLSAMALRAQAEAA